MSKILKNLGLDRENPGAYGKTVSKGSKKSIESYSPINGELLGTVQLASAADYDRVVKEAQETFLEWRQVPAPERGLLIRDLGDALRDYQDSLGTLITLEMGKILVEGIGEVQEAVDVADYAVGLSRQLYGKTMHSERRQHRMFEQWHPLGVIGVITAFNFPVAVWAWNALIGAVCGDVVLWKPSEFTPLTSVALNNIAREVASKHGFPGLFSLVVGEGPELGIEMADDTRLPLISATGSCRMGRSVAESVGKRLGRSLLELGGNNAIVILDDADLDLAVRAALFSAVGTAGQRCTSTRRILVGKKIRKKFIERLVKAYGQVKIGNPLEKDTLMGPLIHQRAVDQYLHAIEVVKKQGGKVLCGGAVAKSMPSKLYVQPTIVEVEKGTPIVQEETFAPILYVIEIANLDDAIEIHNSVPQGLSSAIFTRDVQATERFLSQTGSDCGIANVNLGTSGAEIGGAFGGEKDTGGGRESGSDSWKQYMRRQTNTINWSSELPLAQGIRFGEDS